MLISGELSSGTIVHIEADDAFSSDDESMDECGVPVKKKAKTPAKLRFRMEGEVITEPLTSPAELYI